ncbi:MAG: 30S ribosome-binding factor RbfA [Anaerolineales bacterium]
MPSPVRLQRIADRIREDLSELLLHEIRDPRLRGVYVTDVRVDRELSYADIYVSTVDASPRREEVLAGLEASSGFIRHVLTQNIHLRTFPRLRFHWDETPQRAEHIEALLRQIREKSQQDEQRSTDS